MLPSSMRVPAAPESGPRNGPLPQSPANTVPSFTAPQGNVPNTISAAQSRSRETHVIQQLKKLFREGSPDEVEKMLRHMDSHGGITALGLFNLVLPERTDAQAAACLQRVLAVLKLSSKQVFHELIIRHNFELAGGLLKLDPSAAQEPHVRWGIDRCIELARLIADLRPDIEQQVSYGHFVKLYAREASQNWRPMEERLASWRGLTERFPHRADDIVAHMGPVDDGSLATYALDHAPLPHKASFWSDALRWFPEKIAPSLAQRPDAADRNLIVAAMASQNYEVLDLACQANSNALKEPDRKGDTPAHVAARHGDAKALNILERHGADMQATNSAGETPRNLKPQPLFDFLGMVA